MLKKSGFYLAATLLAAGHAHAQSAVTLYGIVDQSIRFTNNANAQNGSNVVLTNGAVTNSRFGFKGEEDLGAGMKAIFRLENGFDPQTGQANQNGRLFGRYSYVGLASAYGTVKLGRQDTEGFNLFGEFDPLTVGNYTANSWAYFITGGRIDNAISYDGKFGGLNVGATYGFGEQAGSASRNAYAGAGPCMPRAMPVSARFIRYNAMPPTTWRKCGGWRAATALAQPGCSSVMSAAAMPPAASIRP